MIQYSGGKTDTIWHYIQTFSFLIWLQKYTGHVNAVTLIKMLPSKKTRSTEYFISGAERDKFLNVWYDEIYPIYLSSRSRLYDILLLDCSICNHQWLFCYFIYMRYVYSVCCHAYFFVTVDTNFNLYYSISNQHSQLLPS